MLTDAPALFALIVMMCFSFAGALALLPHLKRDRTARVVFVSLLLFGLFVGYGLHVQRDGYVIFAKK